jgi:hypothetical protein
MPTNTNTRRLLKVAQQHICLPGHPAGAAATSSPIFKNFDPDIPHVPACLILSTPTLLLLDMDLRKLNAPELDKA